MTSCISIPAIPMQLYSDRIDYNGTVIPYSIINVNTPFKVVITTPSIELSFTKMTDHMTGISIGKNKVDKEYGYGGYNIVVNISFDSIVRMVS